LNKEKEQAEDWIYLIDNLTRIEKRKVCTIIGTRISKLKNEGPLTFSDFEILELGLIEGKATDYVEKFLSSAITKTGIPAYICSDQGSDIIPGIKRILNTYPSIKHIPDVIHATANMLKKVFQKKTRWEKFCKQIGKTKNKLKQSKYCELCPPQIRGKSRFLNCVVLINWALRVIELLENKECNNEITLKLGWLFDYKKDILEFHEMITLVRLTNEYVRQKGISKDTWRDVNLLFEEEKKSKKSKELAASIIEFLKKLSADAGEHVIVGSTEILESGYGKAKTLDRECGNSGFTGSILGLAACFGKFDCEAVLEALEATPNKNIEQWKQRVIGETQQSKRRKTLRTNKQESIQSKLTRIKGRKKE